MSKPVSFKFSHTSHGGVILPSADTNTTVEAGGNMFVGLLGDYHVCPRKHHGVTPVIATGFATYAGLPFALVGDFCTCGAVLVESSANTFSD